MSPRLPTTDAAASAHGHCTIRGRCGTHGCRRPAAYECRDGLCPTNSVMLSHDAHHCRHPDNATSHSARQPVSRPCDCCVPADYTHICVPCRSCLSRVWHLPVGHRASSQHRHRPRHRGSFQGRNCAQRHLLNCPCESVAHLTEGSTLHPVPAHCLL